MNFKKIKVMFIALVLSTSSVHAALIELYDFQVNIDKSVHEKSNLPSSVDITNFDLTTGLGSISITIMGQGSHSVDTFFDLDIDEPINTFYNEYGYENGVLELGQSWEIDEPGFLFGDIDTNFINSSYDNENGVDIVTPDDVSFGLGWEFELMSEEFALIDIEITTIKNFAPSQFYLTQVDSATLDKIYLSSNLSIQKISVPEPSTLAIIALGIMGLSSRRLKKQ